MSIAEDKTITEADIEPASSGRFAEARGMIASETSRLIGRLDDNSWEKVGKLLRVANGVFVIGSGRSGLSAQMAAMRLMHLGLAVHVAGEVTAPAIRSGDVLVAVSGSGTTGSVLAAAETAKAVGAKVVAVTIADRSPLVRAADLVVTIPAADKQEHSSAVTAQYAGSLFEQSVLLAFDALFHILWKELSESAESLWLRHANLG